MHDRSEIGAALRATAGGFIALLALLVCLMVAMAVGTARGAESEEEIVPFGIQEGPDPFAGVDCIEDREGKTYCSDLAVNWPRVQVESAESCADQGDGTMICQTPMGKCWESLIDCVRRAERYCREQRQGPAIGARLVLQQLQDGGVVNACLMMCARGEPALCKPGPPAGGGPIIVKPGVPPNTE